ncbi:ABC-2 type transport system permease protein [Bacillus sp. OV322]|uniref:ABC transporter permease n=1 Tax=Bacillus sp. OV322 TaxID=1882764 RepID=UPI0008E5D32C|nr:ABC transporter permease [Bacillus sp. OV322]SFC26759.1 ABC-2 type transport system permease protein [Bacillus sp. OV322]
MTSYLFQDIATMTSRSMRHIFRSADTIITMTLTPIALMLMFVYVFGGAMHAGTSASYVKYLLPGILLQSIASGVAYTAYRLFIDVSKGIFERFHSMPISQSAVLWGHILTSLVSNAISIVVIVLIALVMGFRSTADILNWVGVAEIFLVAVLALTWLAVLAGLSAKTVDGATAFSYPLIFLPFVSSAFVPTSSMPAAVRIFAENQPVTAIVNATRALLNNQSAGNNIWIALSWCLGITIVAYLLAMRKYKKRIFGN